MVPYLKSISNFYQVLHYWKQKQLHLPAHIKYFPQKKISHNLFYQKTRAFVCGNQPALLLRAANRSSSKGTGALHLRRNQPIMGARTAANGGVERWGGVLRKSWRAFPSPPNRSPQLASFQKWGTTTNAPPFAPVTRNPLQHYVLGWRGHQEPRVETLLRNG